MGWVLLFRGPGILSTFRHPTGVNLLWHLVGGCALHAVGPCSIGGDDDDDVDKVLFGSARVGCTPLGNPGDSFSQTP